MIRDGYDRDGLRAARVEDLLTEAAGAEARAYGCREMAKATRILDADRDRLLGDARMLDSIAKMLRNAAAAWGA